MIIDDAGARRIAIDSYLPGVRLAIKELTRMVEELENGDAEPKRGPGRPKKYTADRELDDQEAEVLRLRAQGLTQKEVAEAVGISAVTVSRIEKRRKPGRPKRSSGKPSRATTQTPEYRAAQSQRMRDLWAKRKAKAKRALAAAG